MYARRWTFFRDPAFSTQTDKTDRQHRLQRPMEVSPWHFQASIDCNHILKRSTHKNIADGLTRKLTSLGRFHRFSSRTLRSPTFGVFHRLSFSKVIKFDVL